ncbi:MAG: hypothetical protein HW416_3719 [Chloroflexi bacterium]|nr:hypothetical protein [Chloroflexota bacterium]
MSMLTCLLSVTLTLTAASAQTRADSAAVYGVVLDSLGLSGKTVVLLDSARGGPGQFTPQALPAPISTRHQLQIVTLADILEAGATRTRGAYNTWDRYAVRFRNLRVMLQLGNVQFGEGGTTAMMLYDRATKDSGAWFGEVEAVYEDGKWRVTKVRRKGKRRF